MESDCHIADRSCFIDSSLFTQQILAEILKAKGFSASIIFLLAWRNAACVPIHTAARVPDKVALSQRLEITSYFCCP